MYSPPDFRDARPSQPYRAPQRAAAAPAGPAIDAVVKWFNTEKGFGFVELGDGSGDAFLHIAVVQSAGYDDVAPESKLRVQVGQGQKGRQVTAILEMEPPDPNAVRPRPAAAPRRAPDRQRVDPSTAVPVDGTVKWFTAEKGFGFAVADDGGKDVFIHISVLERAGIPPLAEGQRVQMQAVATAKGREAVAVKLMS